MDNPSFFVAFRSSFLSSAGTCVKRGNRVTPRPVGVLPYSRCLVSAAFLCEWVTGHCEEDFA